MPHTGPRTAVGIKAEKTHGMLARSAHAPTSSTHQVRIIGGLWKRTPLPVIAAQGLRPTPDRVRETVFNWLNHLLDNDWEHRRCLDLFAGSGALGFEAASRGAAAVTMVEAHLPVVRQLELTRDRLEARQITIVRSDAPAFVKACMTQGEGGSFDLVFLDPPYHLAWVEKMLPLCAGVLANNGYLYVETEMALVEGKAPLLESTKASKGKSLTHPPMRLPQGWKIVRADRAGSVFYHLLQHSNGMGLEA